MEPQKKSPRRKLAHLRIRFASFTINFPSTWPPHSSSELFDMSIRSVSGMSYVHGIHFMKRLELSDYYY